MRLTILRVAVPVIVSVRRHVDAAVRRRAFLVILHPRAEAGEIFSANVEPFAYETPARDARVVGDSFVAFVLMRRT